MSNVTEHVDVNVPVSTAYNQWTQFEEFPRFMSGVEEIRQLDDKRLFWKTKIAGVEREFEAEITEQHPDHRIAWKSTGGTEHAGVVTFHRLSDETTRVTVQLDSEPEGVVEKIGDAVGLLKRQVKGDLDRFKELIESQGSASGAWRGEVEQPGEATGAAGEPQVRN
jgi:uncharacterized membrane protein